MPEPLSVGDRPINLTQVLKLGGLVMHGGEAKAMIADGLVKVNGEVELRSAAGRWALGMSWRLMAGRCCFRNSGMVTNSRQKYLPSY